jgi:tetratricopeptide (TPR) repeat protein
MVTVLTWVDILLLCIASVCIGRGSALWRLPRGVVALAIGVGFWGAGLWLLVFLQNNYGFHLSIWHAILFSACLAVSFFFHKAGSHTKQIDERLVRQYIAGHPDSHEAHYHLAMALMEEGLYAEAEEEYRRAIDIHPTAIYHHDLGGLLFMLGRYDEAKVEMERAIQFEPKDRANMPRFLNSLAAILANEGRIEEAVPLWKEAVALGRQIHHKTGETPEGFRKALENLGGAHMVRAGETQFLPLVLDLPKSLLNLHPTICLGAWLGGLSGATAAAMTALVIRWLSTSEVMLDPFSNDFAWGYLIGSLIGTFFSKGRTPTEIGQDFGPFNQSVVTASQYAGVIWGGVAGLTLGHRFALILDGGLGWLVGTVLSMFVISDLATGVYRKAIPQQTNWVIAGEWVEAIRKSSGGLQPYAPALEQLLLFRMPFLLMTLCLFKINSLVGIAMGTVSAVLILPPLLLRKPRLAVSKTEIWSYQVYGGTRQLKWSDINFVCVDDVEWQLHLAHSAADVSTTKEITFPLLLLTDIEREELCAKVVAYLGCEFSRLNVRPLPSGKRGWNAYNHGMESLGRGNFHAPIRHFSRAMDIFVELADGSGIVQSLLGLSRAYSGKGNLVQALAYIERALDYAIAHDEPYLQASVILEEARVMHSFFTDDSRALELAEEAMNSSKESVGDALEITGMIAAERQAWDEALKRFEDARRFFLSSNRADDADGQLINQATVLYQMSEDLLHKGQDVEARQVIQRGVLTWQELEHSKRKLDSPFDLSAKGLSYVRAGFVKKGKRLLDKATKAGGNETFLPAKSTAFYRRSIVLREGGNRKDAYHDLRLAIDCVEAIRRTVVTDWQKQRILNRERISMYEDMIALCLCFPDENTLGIAPSEQAFKYVERAKSRAFLDLLERSERERDREQVTRGWDRDITLSLSDLLEQSQRERKHMIQDWGQGVTLNLMEVKRLL